jgi:hypothetical protein
MSNATASTHHAAPTEGAFPSRGRVGMFCLIGPPAANTGKFTVGGVAEIITMLMRSLRVLPTCAKKWCRLWPGRLRCRT